VLDGQRKELANGNFSQLNSYTFEVTQHSETPFVITNTNNIKPAYKILIVKQLDNL
jgi:hypothetical protein